MGRDWTLIAKLLTSLPAAHERSETHFTRSVNQDLRNSVA
jgi:hypothetical protein